MTGHAVPSLIGQVEVAVGGAIARLRPELAGADPVVRPSEHAAFQSNVALSLARRAGREPVELATGIADALPLHPGRRHAHRGRPRARTPPPVRAPVRPREGVHRPLRGVPMLAAANPLRANRIASCQLAARTLRQGLHLLGVAAPERM